MGKLLAMAIHWHTKIMTNELHPIQSEMVIHNIDYHHSVPDTGKTAGSAKLAQVSQWDGRAIIFSVRHL